MRSFATIVAFALTAAFAASLAASSRLAQRTPQASCYVGEYCEADTDCGDTSGGCYCDIANVSQNMPLCILWYVLIILMQYTCEAA